MLSNSMSNAGYLTAALPHISRWSAIRPSNRPAVFIPFASVTRDWDEYAMMVSQPLARAGIEVQSLHRLTDTREALSNADRVIVGGGNTFALLRHMRIQGLMPLLGQRVKHGQCSYLGWSAGANLACPTIRTTNDMPIVDPLGFDALGLVEFQINPHFMMGQPVGHRGETRIQRLNEFCTRDPHTAVLALPEGTGIHVRGARVELFGGHGFLFSHGLSPVVLKPGLIDQAVGQHAFEMR